MTNIVRIQLNQQAKIGKAILELIDNDKPFGNTENETLFLNYFDIGEEHFRAIHLLLSNDCNGSAFALVRTFYETFFRALWMNAVATPEKIKKIRNNNFKFKNMYSIVNELDKYYTGTDFFQELKLGVWNIMSDFTHSGTKQLSRRWQDDKLEPNYTDCEILEIIIEVTKTHLWFADMLFQIHGYKDESDSVFKIYTKYKKDINLIEMRSKRK